MDSWPVMVAMVTNKYIWRPEALTLKRMMAFVMIFVNSASSVSLFIFKVVNSNELLITFSSSLLGFGGNPAPHLPHCCGQCLVCGSDLSRSLQRFLETTDKHKDTRVLLCDFKPWGLSVLFIKAIKIPTLLTLQDSLKTYRALDVKII